MHFLNKDMHRRECSIGHRGNRKGRMDMDCLLDGSRKSLWKHDQRKLGICYQLGEHYWVFGVKALQYLSEQD